LFALFLRAAFLDDYLADFLFAGRRCGDGHDAVPILARQL
jgi:hypothetical protein